MLQLEMMVILFNRQPSLRKKSIHQTQTKKTTQIKKRRKKKYKKKKRKKERHELFYKDE